MLEFVLLTGLLALVVPLTLYFSGRVAGRNVWGLFLRGYEKHGAGAYRAQLRPVWVAGKPPLSVHLAAASSFILGQMVVPGALAALVGWLVGFEILARGIHSAHDYVVLILMLSSPTGLMIGGRLLGVGLGLLQRSENASKKARSLAYFSLGHNVALLVLLGLVQVFSPSDSAYFPAIYACISILQAIGLLKAARDVEAHDAAEEHDQAIAMRPPQLVDHPA